MKTQPTLNLARRLRAGLAFAILIVGVPTAAAAPPAKASLVFSSTAQSIVAGAYSDPAFPITVRLQGASGPASVSLASSSGSGGFRNAGNTTTITFVTIPAGQTSASFLYRDTVAGKPSISATARASNGQFNGNVSASQTETIVPAPATKLVVSPASVKINAGATQSYTAAGQDQFGNSTGDVTSKAVFTIMPDGSCTGSTCTATVPGSHTVTASYAGLTGTATLTVKAGAFDHIGVTPTFSAVSTGSGQAYTVTAYDVNNAILGDVTSLSTFTIGPDGSCTANTCSPATAVLHTVTATYGGKQATASLAGTAPCTSSGPTGGLYTLTLCLSPTNGTGISGQSSVTATITINGTDPHTAKVIFSLDDQYLLTDYQTPYTFALPSARWTDGTHLLSAIAIERDGFTSDRAVVALTFQNGVVTPPGQATGFTPTAGTSPAAGTPYALAAVGDGAGGESGATAVSNLLAGWNPNLFLYLGDVYEKGTPTEFLNWYGASGGNFFGRFRSITNPTIGNHEYENGVAPGYFDYWASPPDYYSVDTPVGWHVVSLNSNLSGAVGSSQYQWLSQDLASTTVPCTLVYFHHPLFNIGVEPVKAGFTDIWPLLAQRGVDVVLTGHDHDYQRWVPLGADGTPDPAGPTEFVVGTGGHSLQSFVSTDPRVANSASGSFGAIRFDLSPGGASYRYVTTAGATLDSGALACNPSATDTTPPSVPANLTATTVPQTNISPGIVNLSWDASTDNVGVSGYAIYRDGTQVGTVGTQTTYADQTVQPETTYGYQVLAMDLKGNNSALSTPALSVTTPPIAPIFSDGFESGDLSNWTTVTGLQTENTDTYGGSNYAAEGTAPTGTEAAYAWKTLPAPLTNIAYTIHFKIISKSGSSLYLERFRSGPTATSLLGVYVSSTGKLGIRNDVAASSTSSATAVTLGAWHTLRVQVGIADASSQVAVWLDGTVVSDLTGTQSLGTNRVDRIQLGDKDNGSPNGTTYDVLYDDVVVDTASADSEPPSVPADLSATTVAQTQATPGIVNLSWDASTDNVGVSGYAIYRDGTQVGTVVGSQTAFADQPVDPETTYSYQVLAMDAYGNQSALSTPPLSVTTPPIALIFSDGFESGDLSNWTTVTKTGNGDLSPETANVYTGTYAAEATATALTDGAYASKTLPVAQTSLYYRIRFKINSMTGTSVYLGRLRTGANGALLGVYVSNTGKLGLRNDVTSTSTTSTTPVSLGPLGAWHTLQVQVSIADTSSQVAVWLDGTAVSDLTGTQSLGTNPIGRIQLGDSSTGKTYDVLYDDVAADTASIP